MKIFVTVGTTRFDSLIRSIDESCYFSDHECIMQTGPSGLVPDRFQSFSYTSEINKYYDWADIIISHAGAGTIYKLLSMRKRLIIIPNTDRLDQHQFDIAEFMSKNNYAVAVDSPSLLPQALDRAATMSFRTFPDQPFFAADDIVDFIDQ